MKRAIVRIPILVALAIVLTAATVHPSFAQPPEAELVTASNGMVSSGHYLATRAGLDVLKEGGNAIDAAVTVGFALAVVLPSAGNIGGGGFMVAHLDDSRRDIAIDYREKAPNAATRDMYLGPDGEPDANLSQFSWLASGVPGSVAGMLHALEKYGTISRERALRPAIDLAEYGFHVDAYLHRSLVSVKRRMESCPASMAAFYKPGGEPYEEGELFVQKDLARTLRLISRDGADAFYKGEIADLIARDMAANGGLITKEDLAGYRPAERKPVKGNYRGATIVSMPPPSSGGVHVVEMLNILEDYPLGAWGHNSAETIHVMTEAMRRAYADRSEYLGDPDFYPVPVRGLISKKYAAELRKGIDRTHATPSTEIKPGNPIPYESDNTTHYSVMDRFGNAVAVTTTLNFSYGSGKTIAGTGMLLNDEMDDFSAKPGSPNGFGLLGNEANAIAPQKRMLSSMTPTIVLKQGNPWLVTGSPGGSRIITTTLQMICNCIDHGMNPAGATSAVRIHHQWQPDTLLAERGLDPAVVERLRELGHTVTVRGSMGVTQTIMRRDGVFLGAADKRITSSSAMGY